MWIFYATQQHTVQQVNNIATVNKYQIRMKAARRRFDSAVDVGKSLLVLM